MRKFITAWLASKKPQVILRVKIVGSDFRFGVFDFWGNDGFFYASSFCFDDHRVYGTLQNMSTVRIGGKAEGDEIEVAKSLPTVFDQYLVAYTTKEEYVKNRSKVLTEEQLTQILSKNYEKVLSAVWVSSTVNFSVVDVVLRGSSSVIVYYSLSGKIYMPLKFSIGEPSLIKAQNFGPVTTEFRSFVESIGEILGGVIWY